MSDVSATTIEATSKDSPPKVTIRLNGELGNIVSGGNGQDGDIMLFNGGVTGDKLHDSNQANIHVDGKSSTVRLGGTTGSSGLLSVQGGAPFSVSKIDLGGNEGAHIKMTPSPSNALSTTSIHLDGETGTIGLRPVVSATDNTVTKGGNLTVFDTVGTSRIQLDGQNGDLTLRGRVANDGTESGANLKLLDGKGTVRIQLDGHTGNMTLTGDIFLTGADCAEQFAMGGSETVEPGTVVVIQEGDVLGASQRPYDKRVAGVISGAGTCRPGIVLNRRDSSEYHRPVALVGRAYCKVDAQYAPIEVGDLLTTSATEGHAMKASDPLRAFGAVIGKALQPLKQGQGMIPILIAMQ